MSTSSVGQREDAFSVSIIISTYNRSADLMETLGSVLIQTKKPREVLVVDDSTTNDVEREVLTLKKDFHSKEMDLCYSRNPGRRSLPSARNYGATLTTGNVVLFLDDDVILGERYIEGILKVYSAHPEAKGVQGFWRTAEHPDVLFHLTNMINRFFWIGYYRKDDCRVLPSFEAVYPLSLSKVLNCEWLSGCNQSYLRKILDEFTFDDKLRRYAPGGEDVDFSLRVFRRNPGGLFITPDAKLTHKNSPMSRTPNKILATMRCVYQEYFFHKNIKPTFRNKMAFAWNRFGTLCMAAMVTIFRIAASEEPGAAGVMNTIVAQLYCLNHRRQIKEGNLEFLNEHLNI